MDGNDTDREPTVGLVDPGTGISLGIRAWGPPADGGTSFVLVHGLASNARLWDGVARRLTELGHGAVAIDLRGHGRSDKPAADPETYATGTVADEVAMTCRRLESAGDIAPRPVVVGQSWGGNVVLEMARRHPDTVRGVCGVDGGTIELSAVFPDWDSCARALAPPRLAGTPAVRLRAAIAAAHPDWSAEAVAATMDNMEHLPDGTVRPWLDRERHMVVLKGLWEHVPSRIFAEIDVPVLLAPAGPADADPLGVRGRTALAERDLRRCRVHWFDGADHDIHAQHPRRLAEVLDHETRSGIFAEDTHRRGGTQ